MRTTSAIYINLKKLKVRTSKALFLIIPITVLVGLSVIISSQTDNIQKALNKYVFDKIKDENTVLQVTYQIDQSSFQMGGGRGQNEIANQSGFTESDLAQIESLDNVTSASIDYIVPISNAKSSDLIDGSTISFGQLLALDESMASYYTSDDFSFVEGSEVPIILNANSFIETYENWNGQDEIVIDMTTARQGPPSSFEEGQNPMEQNSPIKTRAIDFSTDGLIGKTFTITFGGFSDISDFEIVREEGQMVFEKLSTDEISSGEAVRESAIGKYWNYDKLASGLTYKFKVVGIIEKEGNTSVYVPESFAKYVTQQYIQNEIDARNGTAIPADDLNSTFGGITYDGSELSTEGFGFGGRMMGFGGGMPPRDGGGPAQAFNQSEETTESYRIPGLVIKVNEDDSSDVEGVITDSTIFNNSIKRGNSISVKINSIFNRDSVVDKLNELGYAYQDLNNLDELTNIQNTLNKVSTGVVVAFIILTSAVIILTMSKFVSESTKEIGIFRAVGFTKKNILIIYLLQAFLYTVVGYIAGLIIGLFINLAVAKFSSTWFEGFVANTVNQTIAVTDSINSAIFNGVNLVSILILSGILFIVTLLLALFPALRASGVSPVEAIKSE